MHFNHLLVKAMGKTDGRLNMQDHEHAVLEELNLLKILGELSHDSLDDLEEETVVEIVRNELVDSHIRAWTLHHDLLKGISV